MKSTDKFLIGIVAGIIILIVVALVVALGKPEDTYHNTNTPESVVHDYLLALQKEDYPKAYGYLSSTIKGYPRTTGKFVADIENSGWNFYSINENTFSIDLEEVKITGNSASVVVHSSQFRGGGIFESGQSYRTFEVKLIMVKNEWKITYSDYGFAYCWANQGGCK